jgi:surface antigen
LTPTRNFQQGSRPCREFTTVVAAGEKKERLKGVACRRGEGDWDVL